MCFVAKDHKRKAAPSSQHFKGVVEITLTRERCVPFVCAEEYSAMRRCVSFVSAVFV